MSTYLAFGMVLSDGKSLIFIFTHNLLTNSFIFYLGYTLKEAFTSCFISGICLWVFTVTGLSSILMRVIPKSVKLATIVGMGLQIAVVGMVTVQFIVRNEETLIGLGDMKNYKVLAHSLTHSFINSFIYLLTYSLTYLLTHSGVVYIFRFTNHGNVVISPSKWCYID